MTTNDDDDEGVRKLRCLGRLEDPSGSAVKWTLTWTKKQYVIKLVPDGRKCELCPHLDTDLDPCSLKMVPPVKEQCWWSYPPGCKTGKTDGTICGYCNRYFMARVKPQRVTLTCYKGQLGADEKKLNAHQQAIVVLKEQIVLRGFSRNAKFEWEMIEEKSLTLVKTMEMNVAKPGWRHVDWEFYTKDAEFGNGNDLYSHQAGLDAGHREFIWEGKRGVLVPDKPITHIQFNDKIAGHITETLASGTGEELSKDEMESNLQGLSKTFFSAGAKSFDGIAAASDTSCSNHFAALMNLGQAPASSAPQVAQGGAPASSGSGAPSPPAASGKAATATATPEKQTGDTKADSLDGSSAKGKAKAKAKEKAAAGHSTQSADDGIQKKETRGRKPKDLHVQLQTLCQEFAEASPTSTVYWGAESKTGMKQFELLNKDAQARVKKAKVPEEVASYRKLLKHTNSIHTVLVAVQDHGLGTPGFSAAFDMVETSCALDPQAAWGLGMQTCFSSAFSLRSAA